jgi:hypothetical protein
MGIGPGEVEIVGSWSMVSGRLTEDDVRRRINLLIKSELQHVATTKDGRKNPIGTQMTDGFGNSLIFTARCKVAAPSRSLRVPRRPPKSTEYPWRVRRGYEANLVVFSNNSVAQEMRLLRAVADTSR